MTSHLHRRHLLGLAVAAGLAAPLGAWAQARGRTPTEGKEFKTLRQPQPVEGNQIEVLEFFWYGCPACNAVEPALEAWRKKLPPDVVYRRLPVAFDAPRQPHTRIYYTLEAIKRVDDLHPRVFNAYHKEKRRLLDPNEIADFMAAQGVDRKVWLDNYNSFTVSTRTNRAAQVWQGYKIEGTPSVAVDGRWLTSPAEAGGLDEFFNTLNYLVDRARRERAGGGAKK
jgi:protein dithiol oxidoreductase (disulfide-forming)